MRAALIFLILLIKGSFIFAQYQNPFTYLGHSRQEVISHRDANEIGKYVVQPDVASSNELVYSIQYGDNIIGAEYYIFNSKNTCEKVIYTYPLNSWWERVAYFRDTFIYDLSVVATPNDESSAIYYKSDLYKAYMAIQFCDRNGVYGDKMLLIFYLQT